MIWKKNIQNQSTIVLRGARDKNWGCNSVVEYLDVMCKALDSIITIIQNDKHKELYRWISNSWSGYQSGFYRDTTPTAHKFGAERGLEGWGGVRNSIYFEELVHVLIEAGKVKTCHADWQGEDQRKRTVGAAQAQRCLLAELSFPQGISVFFSFSLCVCAHGCGWAHLCSPKWRPVINVGFLSQSLHLTVLRQALCHWP